MLRSLWILLMFSCCVTRRDVGASELDRVELDSGRRFGGASSNMLVPERGDLLEPAVTGPNIDGDRNIQHAYDNTWPWSWIWSCGGSALPLRWRFLRCDGKRGSAQEEGKGADDDLSKRESMFKKVRFHSWGGKRGDTEEPNNAEVERGAASAGRMEPGDDYQEMRKRGDANQRVVLRVPFNAWGGKRNDPVKKVRFHSWGGKRAPGLSAMSVRHAPRVPFKAWGGKRTPEELGPTPDFDFAK